MCNPVALGIYRDRYLSVESKSELWRQVIIEKSKKVERIFAGMWKSGDLLVLKQVIHYYGHRHTRQDLAVVLSSVK